MPPIKDVKTFMFIMISKLEHIFKIKQNKTNNDSNTHKNLNY